MQWSTRNLGGRSSGPLQVIGQVESNGDEVQRSGCLSSVLLGTNDDVHGG
jgi:hypothetical protein